METKTEQGAIEARMASGEPFTYGGLCQDRVARREGGPMGDKDRLIDRTIQKWRRKGWIAFERVGSTSVWSLTAEYAKPHGEA